MHRLVRVGTGAMRMARTSSIEVEPASSSASSSLPRCPTDLAPRRQRRPVVAVAIHRDRRSRRFHVPARPRMAARALGHHQAARHRAGRSQQACAWPVAQQSLHLAHVKPARHGQGQCAQRDQQQFATEFHASPRRHRASRDGSGGRGVAAAIAARAHHLHEGSQQRTTLCIVRSHRHRPAQAHAAGLTRVAEHHDVVDLVAALKTFASQCMCGLGKCHAGHFAGRVVLQIALGDRPVSSASRLASLAGQTLSTITRFGSPVQSP